MIEILSILNPIVIQICALAIFLYIIRIFFLVGVKTPLKASMTGKTIIITGASAGIGKATAIQLLEDGSDVIFACRDKSKALGVINSLNDEFRKRAHFIELDLCSFKSVLSFTKEFKSKFNKVDILINNAATYPFNFTITEDKVEQVLQGNVLGHILLTISLIDYFDKNQSKIINLGSFTHTQAEMSIESINSLENDPEFKSLMPYYDNLWYQHLYYTHTKLGTMYFTFFLEEYLNKHFPHIKIASPNPGIVYTEIARFAYNHHIYKYIYNMFFWIYIYIAKTPICGAQSTLHLCYLDHQSFVNGAYYSDCRIRKTSKLSLNEKIREKYMKCAFSLIRRSGNTEIISLLNNFI
jgi:NAD(P)-dependent dehydrogenase (short-subunit alcohol dehydrogenase family)